MKALIFDTETTGKADFKADPIAPQQPKLVQLGALLIDLNTGRELGSADLIVFPSSWDIPQEVALIHGVTQQIAEEVGLDLDHVINVFLGMVNAADMIVCHNTAFDTIVMRRAVAMVQLALEGAVGDDPFGDKSIVCTMKAATPIVKKKGKRPLHNEDYKWPKLAECMKFFFDEELEGAHNAIIDCRATARVLMKLVEQGAIALPSPAPADAA
ncbi:3'-5' exonuclease [Pseudaminobacter sp. 19-2017]|uniref:3'-5' exonuclease n=1 Tax=Pseudaminobacter soli (ex Zhang et al. 2022) TaxID=2831468 RepID=A0A942E0Q1_9HYPH|nr:3'-5' exonuclease [Pseudaminobacter soli]MBS3648730.1 3'-5' exonuclease [Pseudaminobacter soli]